MTHFLRRSLAVIIPGSMLCVIGFTPSKKKDNKKYKSPRGGSSGRGGGRGDSQSEEEVRRMVLEYYGKVLKTNKDLKTAACCTTVKPPQQIRDALKKVPQEIKSRYYGCGSPLPFGISGMTVVDLGSGSGQDCYVAAQLVGPRGKVIGVDMTDSQLQVATRHADNYCRRVLGFPQVNVSFLKGYIELLPDLIPADSVDLVISNCVVNLSPCKDKVLRGVWNSLREGGEFYFSDVYCDRRLSQTVREHPVLVGECIGGALYIEDFRRLCQEVGFTDPRELTRSEIVIDDPELRKLLGNAKFYSITYRLFKCPELEDRCEDYGQVAVYHGTIPGHLNSYKLDNHHTFETGKPMLVCSNTANMVGGKSWLSKHFTITGDTTGVHFGLFDCSSDCAPDSADCGEGACC